MPQLSVSNFLDVVERSGLVDKSRLAKTLADLERDAGASALTDSRVVSSRLTEEGLLTDWQTARLLEGRSRGFFVGKYKLLDHLGTGGMSTVYLAEHVVMRRRVAVKVLPMNRVNDSSYLARFHREARAAASLDHPNIVRAFDVDNDGNVHYMVMEYVEGEDLKAMVDRDGPLPFATAADYIRQAADGLEHAHQAGLIHRDMKPANLLIDSKGTVKVLDLGLARFSDEEEASLTSEHDEKMLGTVDYLAPEQAVNSHMVDSRADIYSLGCTLYFAMTGQPPYPSGTLAQRVFMHQTQEPPSIYHKRPNAPQDLVTVCRRMMAKSPEQRYQTAGEVSRALAHWLEREARRPSRTGEVHEEELKLAPLDDESKRSPASLPAAAPTAPAKAAAGSDAAAEAPPATASGSDVARRGAAPARPSQAARPAAEITTPSAVPTTSPLDDLLAEIPLSSPGTSGPTPLISASGSGRLRKSGPKKAVRHSLWDSTWFLIGVGALLALVLIIAWLVYSAVSG